MFTVQDLANLAPMKANWDLKRDVAKRLQKLEKRTNKAIAEILRALCAPRRPLPCHAAHSPMRVLAGDRISKQADGADLISAIAARERA